jgi:two-component system OmpR family sensor kinase/two-component system sensor histidine kinase BaeS
MRHSPWQHPHRPWKGSRRFIFWRFALFFGGLILFFMFAIGVVLFLLLRVFQPEASLPESLLLVICGIPVAFFILAVLMGGLGFRRFGTPFVAVMNAIDAVSEGDLSVRVPERGPGEFRRLAQRFNRMIMELERAEQQRRNMTADIAHELRTPLHLIQGSLEGMLDGVYEPNEENLSSTLEETRQLARLVNDLQTLSLAEAGALPLHPITFPAGDLLRDAATSLSTQAQEAGISLRLELPQDEADLRLYADPDRLDQVVTNLALNALRHTPPGGEIAFGAAAVAEGVQLIVADTGTGIAPEDLPYIFDRFWRGDKARTRTRDTGSGLGLAIAKQLVQSHGGLIEVESQPGEGTRFTILLPRAG